MSSRGRQAGGSLGFAAQAESARRAALWKAGRFHDLRREAVTARAAAGTSDNRRDDTAEKAALLVREGAAFGRASALAQTHGMVQDPDEATRALSAQWDYVPFIMEDGGRPGAHASAFLAALDKREAPREYFGVRVSLKTRILQAISTTLHAASGHVPSSRRA